VKVIKSDTIRENESEIITIKGVKLEETGYEKRSAETIRDRLEEKIRKARELKEIVMRREK
jgi:hypothetical protein